MLQREQEEFFKFFGIAPPPGMSAEAAGRFIQAYLKDPERAARWERRARPPTARPAPPPPPPPVAPTAPAAPRPMPPVEETLPLEFTGSGAEYFGIWIVNVVLMIATFGIYSAWAKARRLQYFYRHTRLDGSAFDYHGTGMAIFKGRAIAAVLFFAYAAAAKVSVVAGALLLVPVGFALPWLLRNSFRFRMRNSSYRGLRFRFAGTLRDSYTTFLAAPAVVVVTWLFVDRVLAVLMALVLVPWAYQRLKRYQHGNTCFGTTPFEFHATAGQFYRECLYVGAIGLTPVALFAYAFARPNDQSPLWIFGMIFAVILFVLSVQVIIPVVQTRLQNLVWNHTTLGPHRFTSNVSVMRLFMIVIVNNLLVALTFGLYLPWAAVRVARYRVECLQLVAQGGLDSFIGAQEQDAAAFGEEAAGFLDLDIAL